MTETMRNYFEDEKEAGYEVLQYVFKCEDALEIAEQMLELKNISGRWIAEYETLTMTAVSEDREEQKEIKEFLEKLQNL